MRTVIDYEALSAWSTLAAAVATVAAIIVALAQSARARNDLRRQLQHQNWLEQKRLEEQHLNRLLDLIDHSYVTAQDFYFSFLRLLGPVGLGQPTSAGFDDEVRRELDAFARRGADAERTVGSFLNLMLALREYHQQRNDGSAAAEYDSLVGEVNQALTAGATLREWLSDPNVVLATDPEKYFDLPHVTVAREKSNAAARRIARRLVRLYEHSPPSG